MLWSECYFSLMTIAVVQEEYERAMNQGKQAITIHMRNTGLSLGVRDRGLLQQKSAMTAGEIMV